MRLRSRRNCPWPESLALGRNESGRDEIIDLNAAQYFAQCCRSVFYWSLVRGKLLPDDLKERLTMQIRRRTERIMELFPPRALMTLPEGGGLAELIEDNL